MSKRFMNCILIVVIVLNAALFLCGCGRSSKHSKEYFDLLKAGDRAQEAGNYEDALSAYQKAIEMNPAVPQAYHRMFDTYVRDERFDDALQFALDNYQNFSTKMTAQSDVTYQDDAAYQSDTAGGEESRLYVNMTPRQETALFFAKAMDLGLHRGAALKNVYPQNEMSEFVAYVCEKQEAIDDEELTAACADVTDTGSKYSDIVTRMREAGVLVSADLSELSPEELLERGLGDPAPETLAAMAAADNSADDQTASGTANAGEADQTTPGTVNAGEASQTASATANNGEADQTTPGTVNAGEASQTAPGAASTSAASQIIPGAPSTVTASLITLESAESFEKELRVLLAEDPDLIFLYFDIANLYIQAGDRERAATVYQEGQQVLADMLNERGYITQAAVPLIEDQFSNLYCLGYAASADSIEEAGTIMTTEQYKEALEEARRGVDLLPLSEEEKSAVQSAYEMYNGQLDECIEIRSEFQKVDLEAQLQVFADHRSEWDINRTDSLPATSFTMADINNNGRLEVIVSGTTGTGIYSETYVFEVNEDATGLNRYSITDGTSPDIARMDSTEVYLVEGNYKISCTNATAHGWESADFEKQSLSLNDTGIIIETLGIGHRLTVINGDDELEYFDSDHNPISEAEFDSLYDSVYAGCPKGKMKFIWITPGYGGSMSLDQLRESWEGFSCSLY